MNVYKVRFEYLLDEQNDVWELPVEASDPEDAKARIQRGRAPLRVKAVTEVSRCWLCGRDVSDGDYVNVSLEDGSVGHTCSRCWEKADVEIPLDYTEDEQLREGQPEFNGSFR